MKVSVLIPYRLESEERHAALLWVLARYAALWPEYEICIGTSNETPFRRTKALNSAFRKSTGDIVVVNDADTFVTAHSFNAAMAAAETGQWALPYHLYFNLDEQCSRPILEGECDIEPVEEQLTYDHRIDAQKHPPDGSVSGVVVIPREAYEKVGGFDERFHVWGYEDDAFAWMLDRHWGRHQRLTGLCCHLWHPRGPDVDFHHPSTKENEALFQRIKTGRD